MIYFEPPISEIGSECSFDAALTSKIHGYAVESNGKILIPLIESLEPGQGNVGRFLDSLSPRCEIPTVMNAKLRGMLERRGWTVRIEDDPQWGRVEIFCHPLALL